MNIKASLAVLIMLTCAAATAQPKAYSFSDIQHRDQTQQWREYMKTDKDCIAYFSDDKITLNIDHVYHLTVKTITHLPNDGVIYLCADEDENDVTITLIGDDRMFVYDGENRFLINFVQEKVADTQNPTKKTVTSPVANLED